MKALLTLIQPAFEWTWHNSVQVALLVGLVLVVQTVLARWLTPRLRYALSLLILLRLLLPLAPPSPLSLQNLWPRATAPAAPPAAAPVVVEPLSPTAITLEPLPVEPLPAPPAITPSVSSPPKRPPAISLAEGLVLAWACGLIVLVGLAGWRYAQWCRRVRCGRRLSETRMLALLDEAREAMGVRRPVSLAAVAQLTSPAVFGFRQVRLLLPEAVLDQLTDQDLRLLFLHEMAHVRRQDMLLNLLLMAVQFVHWFNPLVWLGLHRLRADRELVCDAMVLQRTKPEERLGYGMLLLKLLMDFPVAQAIVPTAVPVVSSKRELKRRIISIKHHRHANPAVRVATGLMVITLGCAAFTGAKEPSGTRVTNPAADVGPATDSNQPPALVPDSETRHESTISGNADARFRELARLNHLLNDLIPHLSSPKDPEFDQKLQLREKLLQSAGRLRDSLYESGDLVGLTLWAPDIQPLKLHSRLRGMASYTNLYDGWSFSMGDDMVTTLVPPSCVASLKSDFCCMTNRIYWGKLRQIGGSRDDAVFRLPDGREVDLEECEKWLNESIAGGWMIGIAGESRRSGHYVINAMRKKAGTGAMLTGSSQQSPGVSDSPADESIPKSSAAADKPVEVTRFYHLTTMFADLEQAITNSYKGTYLIDSEHKLVMARSTPEQLDVMENIIRDAGSATTLATRKLINSAPTNRLLVSGVPGTTNLVVRIDAQGQLFLGKRHVTIEELKTILTQELAKHPAPGLDITAERDTPIRILIKVVEADKQARLEIGATSDTSNPRLSIIQVESAPPASDDGRPRAINNGKPIPDNWSRRLKEAPQAPSQKVLTDQFSGQTGVLVIPSETNGLFSLYDRVLTTAVASRWQQLVAEHSDSPPPVSVSLEFHVHSNGRVTELNTVQNAGNEVFMLIAQKAVLDFAPYAPWPSDLRREYPNEYRVLRLKFFCREKRKLGSGTDDPGLTHKDGRKDAGVTAMDEVAAALGFASGPSSGAVPGTTHNLHGQVVPMPTNITYIGSVELSDAPITLRYVKTGEFNDRGYLSYGTIFWATNHTTNLYAVHLSGIECREGTNWTLRPLALAHPLPMSFRLHPDPAPALFLKPYAAGYATVELPGQPTNGHWRIRADLSEKTADPEVIQRNLDLIRRGRDPQTQALGFSGDHYPTNSIWFKSAGQVVSQEVSEE